MYPGLSYVSETSLPRQDNSGQGNRDCDIGPLEDSVKLCIAAFGTVPGTLDMRGSTKKPSFPRKVACIWSDDSETPAVSAESTLGILQGAEGVRGGVGRGGSLTLK